MKARNEGSEWKSGSSPGGDAVVSSFLENSLFIQKGIR